MGAKYTALAGVVNKDPAGLDIRDNTVTGDIGGGILIDYNGPPIVIEGNQIIEVVNNWTNR